MKIGILTFTACDNYGQRLQNYALQEILRKSGNEVSTILQSEDSITFVRLFELLIKLLIGKEKNWSIFKRKIKFYLFDKKHIKYTKMVDTYKPNNKIDKQFDRFVSGSDQVWAPVLYRMPMYMQSFALSQKKYSYAASIATYEIDDSVKSEYLKYLRNFKLISVREDISKDLIDSILCNNKTQVDLDPTLLIDKDEWVKIEKCPKWLLNDKYILVYTLDSPVTEELQKVALDRRLNIISLMDEKSEAFTTDPSEFLYLIHHAKLVYTDSYHGTIFSIIYKKPFIHAVRNVKEYNMNSRFDTLFKKLGINIDDVMKVENNISYTKIMERLENEKKKSKDTIRIIASND